MSEQEARERDAKLVKELHDKYIKSRGITLRKNYVAANLWFLNKYDMDWGNCLPEEQKQK